MNIVNQVTLKNLWLNRKRTLVTIIGVILSAAMITAVPTLVFSFQNSLVQNARVYDGNWHVAINDVAYEYAHQLEQDSKTELAMYRRDLGYARLEGGQNKNKPYLFMAQMDEKSLQNYPLTLLEGRMPESENEVVISQQIEEDGGVHYEIGDQLTLQIGLRLLDEKASASQDENIYSLWQDSPLNEEERFEPRMTTTYKVVGVIKRPQFKLPIDSYQSPGYAVISLLNTHALAAQDTVSVSLLMTKPKSIYQDMPAMAKAIGLNDANIVYNSELLKFMGISANEKVLEALYGFAAVLIVLIIIGSVSLVYNAFAISVSDRTRQFGMLSSVGATGRQIKQSVFFEGLVVSVIGIPLGILAGIFGIGTTLYFLRPLFRSLSQDGGYFVLAVSPWVIIMAAILGAATILISAYLPARRASRSSAMDAIRQTADIQLSEKTVKTPGLLRRIFGIEGDLAVKNLKRSRKHYRATVISLIISIVLFIAVSSMNMYMNKTTNIMYGYADTEISVAVKIENATAPENADLRAQILAVDGIDHHGLLRQTDGHLYLEQSYLNPDLLKQFGDCLHVDENGNIRLMLRICSVGNQEFEQYLDKLGLKPKEYTDVNHPICIVIDQGFYYHPETKKYMVMRVLNRLPTDTVTLYDTGQTTPLQQSGIAMGILADEVPMGVAKESQNPGELTLIVSDEIYDHIAEAFGEQLKSEDFIFLVTKQSAQVAEQIKSILQERSMDTDNVINVDAYHQNQRNVVLLRSVFIYGFIILISLIGVANVFNTVSTNIELRRREFAMLRSVGMTPQGFNRMIYFESLFYGLKSLLYGLPIGLGVSVLIYTALIQGIQMLFIIPWFHMGVCVITVLLIVFITMMYAISRLKKENIVDTLRRESI